MKFTRFVLLASCLLAGNAFTHAVDPGVQEAIEIFFKTPRFSQVALSPDGTHISMITHSENFNALRTYEVGTGEVYGVRGQGGQSINYYVWVDAENLIYNVVLWNLYNVGYYEADKHFQDIRMIGTKMPHHSYNVTLPEESLVLSDSLVSVPARALFRDYTNNNSYPDLVYYNTKTHILFNRQINNEKAIDWECDSKGIVRIKKYMTEPGEYGFSHRWTEEEEWQPISVSGDSWVMGFDETDKRLFVVDENEEGVFEFRIFDIEKGEFIGRAISHKQYSCNPETLHDNETGAVIGAIYYFERPKVIYFDEGYRLIHDALQRIFPDELVVILGKTKAGAILFQVTGDRIPLRVYKMDPNAEEKLVLILNKAEWIRKEHCQPMEPIKFESRDGAMIHGYLTRSRLKTNNPGPTVMLVHGGPFYRDTWGFNSEAQFLAYLGYNVIQVNFRGSSGFNKDYSVEKLVSICRYAIDDVADGARWAISERIADPNRIAIMGGSFGGYAALAGAAFEPELYKVAIGSAGVYNYDRQLEESIGSESPLTLWLEPIVGDLYDNPQMYRDLSPVNFADQINAEVLLMHGGADTRVNASQTKQMSKALDKAGKDHEVDINTWGVHGIYKQNESFRYGELVGEFLKKHL